jgi:hypothetical protein
MSGNTGFLEIILKIVSSSHDGVKHTTLIAFPGLRDQAYRLMPSHDDNDLCPFLS